MTRIVLVICSCLGLTVVSNLVTSLPDLWHWDIVDSAAVSIFVVILVELSNTVFVNLINITTNIETAALSSLHWRYATWNISSCVTAVANETVVGQGGREGVQWHRWGSQFILVRDDDECDRSAISSDTEGVKQGSPEMKPTGGKLFRWRQSTMWVKPESLKQQKMTWKNKLAKHITSCLVPLVGLFSC